MFIVRLIIGALGFIPEDINMSFKKLHFSYCLRHLQKTVILGTANIFRKTLSIKKMKKMKKKFKKLNKKGLLDSKTNKEKENKVGGRRRINVFGKNNFEKIEEVRVGGKGSSFLN